TAQGRVAVHSKVRGILDRWRWPLRRGPADGSRVPADVWPRLAAAQGDRGWLDAARADVGCGARAPCRPRVLSVAEHSARLRVDLARLKQALEERAITPERDPPVLGRDVVGV